MLRVVAVVLALGGVAGAEEPLTLGDALRLAERNNEIGRIAESRLALARANRRLVWAALLPTVQLNANYTRAPLRERGLGDASVVLQAENTLSAQFLFDARLFDATAFPILKAAPLAEAATTLEAGELRRALAFDVAEAFVGVLTAEAVMKAADERVRFGETSLADATARLSSGLGDRSTRTRAELELATARAARTNRTGDVQLARVVLGNVVGEPVTRPLAPLPDLDETKIDGESRGDLEAIRTRAEAARILVDEPWRRLIPTLGLRGNANATSVPGFLGIPYNWNITATISWAIFDGGIRYAVAAAREAQADELSAQADALKRAIGTQLQDATTRIDVARRSLEEAVARSVLATRNAEEVAARTKSGLASALEQADAATSAFEAATDEARARFALVRARLQLLEALGRWPASKDGR